MVQKSGYVYELYSAEEYVKEEIIKSINREPHLSMVIATVALGMGVDCHYVTQTIMCFHLQMLNHTEVCKNFYSWGCYMYIRTRGTIMIVMTYLHGKESYSYGG